MTRRRVSEWMPSDRLASASSNPPDSTGQIAVTEPVRVKPAQPAWMTWTGRILSFLPVPLFAMSAYFKFNPPPEIAKDFAKLGYTAGQMQIIGAVEVLCVVIYLIPQTAVLGAILLAGYLGGATEVHAHQQDPGFVTPIVIGVILWLGLFLREPRLRALVPFRKS
jgi:hypothetical protein